MIRRIRRHSHSKDAFSVFSGVSGKFHAKRLSVFARQLRALKAVCRDAGSRQRLGRLQERHEHANATAAESARVEVELAGLLIDAGFTIAFLPESGARTADLECYCGPDRFFVEVTHILVNGAGGQQHLGKVVGRDCLDDAQEYSGKAVLLKRIVARMAEKAKQLSLYSAPVILAITVKMAVFAEMKKGTSVEVDVRGLTGGIANTFPHVPQLSGVLLTLWDAQPRETSASIRLSNVSISERTARELAFPRVRLLSWNPRATYPLERSVIRALKERL